MDQVIGEIQKNALEKIVASLGEYRGKQRIDFRIYFQPDTNPDNWVPTKKGINLDIDSWGEFKDLVERIDQAIKSEP